MDNRYCFKDFTEDNYVRLLEKIVEHYEIIGFTYEEILKVRKAVLLRHDVDFSLNRALKLAQIEYRGGVRSTYFIYLHSLYYSVWELEQFKIVKNIIHMGHGIGLHFDPAFYKKTRDIGAGVSLEECAEYEKKIAEDIFDVDINAVSFHNPEAADVLDLKDQYYAGMVNAYSAVIGEQYKYCSDSNGYWRFERLEDVIDYGYDKLHILLHPAWWTPEAMSPYERIQRGIRGRAENNLKIYNENLQNFGRENVGYGGIELEEISKCK